MRDLPKELYGVMEMLDDLGLLQSSEIVREGAREIERLRSQTAQTILQHPAVAVSTRDFSQVNYASVHTSPMAE